MAATNESNIDLTKMRELLHKEHAELLATADDIAADAVRQPAVVPDGIGETEHLVTAEQNEITSRVLAITQSSLDDIDAALKRLDDGTYGVCLDCNEQIAPARLEAMPAAGYCVNCQAARGQ